MTACATSMRTEDRARQAAESARFRIGAGPGRVDVFGGIRRLANYHLLRYPLPANSLEGAFVRHGDQHFVLVNSAVRMTRQRFTAAHELGHAFLEPDSQDVARFEIDLNRLEDRAANRFAAHFLMDEQTVRDAVTGVEDPIGKALALISTFEVSLEAAAIHLKDLGLIGEVDLQIVLQARDVKLSTLAQARGMPVPANVAGDSAIDPGSDYLEGLAALNAAGLLAKQRHEEMRSLRLVI